MNIRSQKGFTLVEIMIVVVIIGLLAAMAVPAFQKVRRNSIQSTLINDASKVAGFANTYMMDYGVASVSADYVNGSVQGELSVYVRQISKGNVLPSTFYASATAYTVGNSALGADSSFSISPEGQKL
jgi:type IV pilus assembly protein PilA